MWIPIRLPVIYCDEAYSNGGRSRQSCWVFSNNKSKNLSFTLKHWNTLECEKRRKKTLSLFDQWPDPFGLI